MRKLLIGLVVLSGMTASVGANAVAMGSHACFSANMDNAFFLDWYRSGIANVTSDTNVWVFCPVPTEINGPIYKYIIVRLGNGNSVSQEYTCHLREIDPFENVVRTVTRRRTIGPGISWDVGWEDITLSDNTNNVFTLACRLPPQGTIANIYVDEYSVPNNP